MNNSKRKRPRLSCLKSPSWRYLSSVGDEMSRLSRSDSSIRGGSRQRSHCTSAAASSSHHYLTWTVNCNWSLKVKYLAVRASIKDSKRTPMDTCFVCDPADLQSRRRNSSTSKNFKSSRKAVSGLRAHRSDFFFVVVGGINLVVMVMHGFRWAWLRHFVIRCACSSSVFLFLHALQDKWKDADLREDSHRKDYHPWGGAFWHYRECQDQNPGQGGDPARPAAFDLRRKAAGGWTHPERLQHSEGVYPSPCPPSSRWCYRANYAHSGPEIQLWQDDLPKVLRSPSPACHQLPQEEVWTHQQPSPQEEAEVNRELWCCAFA